VNLPGASLSPSDLEQLAACGIDAEIAKRALLRRVDTFTGAEIVGRNGGGDYAGWIIPYTAFDDPEHVIEYALRVDHPPLERGRDGQLKAIRKYLWPPGRPNRLYIPPDLRRDLLVDPGVPVMICEGVKKALALWGLAWHGLPDSAESPRWIPVALSGVSNFRGIVGKAEAADGTRVDVKGVVADFERILWQGRTVYILFDSNVRKNENVQIARFTLAKELRTRGAAVLFIDMPADADVNGIDDLVGLWGKDRVIEHLGRVAYDPKKAEPADVRVVIDDIPSVRTFADQRITYVVPPIIPDAGITGLTGDSGCGKSTLSTYLAGLVASGGASFTGQQCEQRQVLYLDRENPAAVVYERLCRLGVEDGGTFKYWGGWLPCEAPAPGSPAVIDWATHCNPKPLIIVDSLIAFIEGDENSSTEIRAFMHQLRQLANLGCPVIVLHHVGKGETSREYRGSSDFKASLDIGLSLTNLGDGAKLGRLRLKAFKTRFLLADDDLILHYRDGRFEADERPNAVSRTVTEQLTALLRAHPGAMTGEFEGLAVAKGLGRDRARQFLEDGIRIRYIRAEAYGNRGKRHFLTERTDDDYSM
jgi:energy-coupling factor transporter ATP-binding protein EcfA2